MKITIPDCNVTSAFGKSGEGFEEKLSSSTNQTETYQAVDRGDSTKA